MCAISRPHPSHESTSIWPNWTGVKIISPSPQSVNLIVPRRDEWNTIWKKSRGQVPRSPLLIYSLDIRTPAGMIMDFRNKFFSLIAITLILCYAYFFALVVLFLSAESELGSVSQYFSSMDLRREKCGQVIQNYLANFTRRY